MMKRVYALAEFCAGCGLCQVYCATQHSDHPENIWKAFKLSKNRPISRLYLERNHVASLALQCRHCDDPACVAACITGAMYKDQLTGLVLVNENKCIGCSTCIVACPYGAIKQDLNQTRVIKCDMCQGSQIPVCVANCPNEALEYREEEV